MMSVLPTAAAVFEKLPRVLRRHRLMQAWMTLTGEDPLQLVRIRDEAFGYADMRDGFLRLIVIDGEYETDFFRLADRLLAQGGTFFDVGANHGLLSAGLAARHGGQIDFHLFEPNGALLPSIQKSLALYPATRWTLNPVAVSRDSGSVAFAIDREQSGASHVVSDGEERVACTTLDRYIDEHEIKSIALLKLDVEGHELAALEGARQCLANRTIEAIYFEYFEKWLSRTHRPADLLDYLAAAGFVVCLCRAFDLDAVGGPTHSLRDGLPGAGLPLAPIAGRALPVATDLLAVPEEHLVPRQFPARAAR